MTRSRVSSRTTSRLLRTRETVAAETPASFATSSRFIGERLEILDLIIFDHGIDQHLAGDGLDVFARLDFNIEELTLADILDSPVAEADESGANGLALGVEDRGFERHMNTS